MSVRRALACTAVLAVAAGLLPGLAAGADPTYDWHVLTITAGPVGADDVKVELHATGEVTGLAPVVLGVGTALDGRLTFLQAYNLGLGRRSVSTSRGAGSVRVDLPRDRAGAGGGIDQYVTVAHLNPGQSYAVLTMETGVAQTAPVVTSAVGSGDAAVSVVAGSGSGVIDAGNPGDGGVSANVDGTGAGAVKATRDLPAGVVGVGVSRCNACRAGWEAPDGRVGGYVMKGPQWAGARGLLPAQRVPEADVSPTAFGGPAGTWTFRWDGLDTASAGNTPAELVYAPVGGAWPWFTPDVSRASATCSGGLSIYDVTTRAVRSRATVTAAGAETRVCVRVEDPVSHVGVGGALVLTGGTRAPSAPSVGTDPAACATQAEPNQAPGPHPWMDETVLGVPTGLDLYQSGSRAVLCASVGGTALDVVVPLGGPGVELRPDPVTYEVG
ncbi:MAG TPA: hypothetical protein VFQ85_00835 [Mycobacteriales bacterium]|nr:hypothetical protein [Mycobacteriales bacterium]